MTHEFAYIAFYSLFALISLGFIWLVGFGEFSYLSGGLIKALYNLFSLVYDLKWLKTKDYQSKAIEESLFLKPIHKAYQGRVHHHVDLACGTGRLPLMLLRTDWYQGQIHALDFSKGMLKAFQDKLKKLTHIDSSRVSLEELDLKIWQAEPASCHSISLLEAGEFVPDFVILVKKISVALKPGGFLLLTKPPESMSWAYPGRCQTTSDLTQLLHKHGLGNLEIHRWSSRYDVVWAWKISESG